MSFDVSLRALIPDIEHICDDLRKFKPYSRVAAQDIPAIQDEFTAIIDCLRKIQVVSRDPRNIHDSRQYSDCIVHVVTAIRRTIRDISKHLTRADQLPNRSRNEAWEDLLTFFWDQGHTTLLERLEIFTEFLRELWPILDGELETSKYDRLHQRILRLLDIQEEDIHKELTQLELERDAATPLIPLKTRSWERRRPGAGPRIDPPPIAPFAPLAFETFRPGPNSPISPPGGEAFFPADLGRPISPPPSSTVFSGESSVASGPSATGSNMFQDHWINTALTADRPSTEFYETGNASQLVDEHMSGVLDSLDKGGYKLLMKFHFDDVSLGFYLRPRDIKIRVYCKYQKNDRKTVACNSLSKLVVRRDGPTLKLCQTKKKKNYIWAGLRFQSYEKMVLFFCAILALKAAERSNEPVKLDNHLLPEEEHIYSATIMDDGYRHALQIFKDSCSDGIRLQASVISGEMKRAPVWVSFIHYKIASRSWMQRIEARKIQLKDFPRYIFRNDYTPREGARGVPELCFDSAQDADEFMQVVDDLANGLYDADR